MDVSPRNLVLIGFMGTGKSTLGRMCAAQLGYAFHDSDGVIEERTGQSVATLFARQGEAAFRKREREVIAELAATPGLVIATGGGAALDPENARRLRQTGFVVLLDAAPDVLLRRVGNVRTRPLLANAPDPRAHIEQLRAQRLPLYRQAAHCHIDTGNRAPRDIVEQIVMLYEISAASTDSVAADAIAADAIAQDSCVVDSIAAHDSR